MDIEQTKRLRRKMQTDLAARREQIHTKPAVDSRPRLLGQFLRVHLKQTHYQREDFAKMLGVHPDVVTLLLRGDLPDWFINDEVVTRVAAALGIQANILRSLLGREITPEQANNNKPGHLPESRSK